jgi:competence protein ComEA
MTGLTRNESSALVFLAAAFVVGIFVRSQRDQLTPIPAMTETVVDPPAVTETIQTESSSLISINHATKSDLERLPGVGPVLAERIIQYRDSRNGFRSLNELTKVRGIGAKKMSVLSQRICLDSTAVR